MLHSVILALAFSLGQPEPTSSDKPSPPPAPVQPAPDRWVVMQTLQGTYPGYLLDENRMQVLGWTDVGFTGSSDRHSNLPMTFNYLANRPVLEQNWLRLERPVVATGTTEPTFGFRSDTILPGTDYRFTVARGLFDRQLTENNGQPNTYGIDPVQFYAEAYFPTFQNGLDIKIGRFYCQYGVELIEAVGNALNSHTYSFANNPFTQTGVLATLKLSDAWSIQLGVANGQDMFIGPGMQPQFLGSVKWSNSNQGDSLTLATILASARFDPSHMLNNADLLDLIYVHKASDRLTYTFECLAGYEKYAPDVGAAYWLGIVNYLTYTCTERLFATARLEFWDDPKGVRTGSRGLYTAPTLGLQLKVRPAIIVRPEIRYDYNGESAPFEGHHGLLTCGLDVILRW